MGECANRERRCREPGSNRSSGFSVDAAEGRQTVRTSVAEQNLPGVSVAVGIDGVVVWAEGFGYADLKASAPVTPDHFKRPGPVLRSWP